MALTTSSAIARDPASVKCTFAGFIHSPVCGVTKPKRLLERRSEDDDLPQATDLLVHLAHASVHGRKATGTSTARHSRASSLRSPSTPPLASRPCWPSEPGSLCTRPFPCPRIAAAGSNTSAATSRARLSMDARGRILYAFRRPHANARTHVVFTPKSLLERPCALIPYPRTHLITYHGVLASASSWRDEVVPAPTHGLRARRGSPKPLSLDRRLRWAELMKRPVDVAVRSSCVASAVPSAS